MLVCRKWDVSIASAVYGRSFLNRDTFRYHPPGSQLYVYRPAVFSCCWELGFPWQSALQTAERKYISARRGEVHEGHD